MVKCGVDSLHNLGRQQQRLDSVRPSKIPGGPRGGAGNYYQKSPRRTTKRGG